ncbi:KTSC domain-containing protein [Streptomyces humicola]|uniref:KTSC domain-containing protein n=1 Tax=Streptomyces humicola TaxID=2953240 RepID=UPI003556FEF3
MEGAEVRTRVESSCVRSIGYEAETFLLQIEFAGGGIYEYAGVPEHIHQGLKRAESHGRYFNRVIRDRF